MTVPRGELRVLGYLFPCGRVGPKLWRIPKGCRTVPSCGIVGMESRIPAVIPQCQNYTCEVLAGTAVKPLDSSFFEGFASQGIQRHREIPANFNGHLVFQHDHSPRRLKPRLPRRFWPNRTDFNAYSSAGSRAGSIANSTADFSTDSNPTPSSFASINPIANGIATLRRIHLPIAGMPLNPGRDAVSAPLQNGAQPLFGALPLVPNLVVAQSGSQKSSGGVRQIPLAVNLKSVGSVVKLPPVAFHYPRVADQQVYPSGRSPVLGMHADPAALEK